MRGIVSRTYMYKGSISLYNVHACLELNSASEVSYKNTPGLNLLAACVKMLTLKFN